MWWVHILTVADAAPARPSAAPVQDGPILPLQEDDYVSVPDTVDYQEEDTDEKDSFVDVKPQPGEQRHFLSHC